MSGYIQSKLYVIMFDVRFKNISLGLKSQWSTDLTIFYFPHQIIEREDDK